VNKFQGNVATRWGQKYEPVATQIYERKTREEVIEFGLIRHHAYPWLGASPDGITPGGRMLEIKCPYRRKITGIPPFYYWIQVQLQLEVCNLPVCDFAEYKFIELDSVESFIMCKSDTQEPENTKGIIIKIPDTKSDESTFIYPETSMTNCEELIYWSITQLEKHPNGRIIYWFLSEYFVTPIKRSAEWFIGNRETLLSGFQKVLEYQTCPEKLAELVAKKEARKRKPSPPKSAVLTLDSFFDNNNVTVTTTNQCVILDSDSD